VESYNLPLDELQKVAENALINGYSWAWGSDVSEKGFSFKNGLAIVPVHDSLITQKGKDSKGFNDAGADRFGNAFDSPMDELNITDSIRQFAFDNYQTTDDHGMHATGLFKDQNGNNYFKIKNSWGTKNDCGGYLYCSMPYFRYKTINIYIHKKAIPKDIAKKLGVSQN
jgi:bleomycin hydrolase